MKNPPPATRIPACSGSEIIGIIIGLLGFFGNEVIRGFPFGRTCFLSQIGFTLGLSAVAALLSLQLVHWHKVYRLRALGIGAQLGLRSGLVAGLISGAAFCVSALIHARAVDYAEEAVAESLRMWASFFVAIAGILPASFIGMLVGSLATMPRQFAAEETAGELPPGDAPKSKALWQCRLSQGIAWVSALGIALPHSLILMSSKPPRPAPEPVANAPIVEAVPVWNYTRPAGLAEASPLRFFILAQKPLPKIVPGSPITISPDGDWLAYCPSDQLGVTLVNLTTAQTVSTLPLASVPTSLAWSPDSKRLLMLSSPENENGRLQVWDTDASASQPMFLPRPKQADLPKGPMYWHKPNQVIFYPDDEPPLRYDLDELRLFPLADPTNLTLTKNLKIEVTLAFPAKEAWRFEAREWISGVALSPRRNPEVAPQTFEKGALSLARPFYPLHRTFPEIGLYPGVSIVPARDGSKLVWADQNLARIFYFGLNPEQPLYYKLSLPAAKAIPENPKALTEALESTMLCAMVYAPMVNPLTGRTVGPDRDLPIGLLRFMDWSGESANVWAAETYFQWHPSAVVADVHQWKEGKFLPSPLLPDPFWWTTLGEGNSSGNVPVKAKALPLHWTPTFAARGDLRCWIGRCAIGRCVAAHRTIPSGSICGRQRSDAGQHCQWH